MSFRDRVGALTDRLLAQPPDTSTPIRGADPDLTRAILTSADDDFFFLIDAADRVRRRFLGTEVRFCSIVNARSGACAEDCAFCAQSAHNKTEVQTYPMVTAGQVAEAAKAARAAGASEFSVVTSGTGADSIDEAAELVEAVAAVRASTGMKACVSAGILAPEVLARLKEAGLNHFHHNLETARSFYPSICGTREWDDNAAAVRAAKDAGLFTCVGGIFGMGETVDQRVEFLHQVAALDVDSVPVNFLNPIPGTPLAGRSLVSPRDALRIIAATRLTMPSKHVVVCGGREVTLRELQSLVFAAGADGLLVGNYLTTAGRDAAADHRLAEDLGLTVREP